MNNTYKRFISIKQLTTIGILSAISIFMGLTGLGFIPLPFMKATIMHIPVIIGAILEGPIVGASIGLVFGLFSLYQNLTAPTLLSPILINPLISVVPRILIGIVSYYVYIFIIKRFNKESLACSFSAALGTITNTCGVLGFTYIFALEKYANAYNVSTDAVGGMLLTIIVTNGIPECIISIIIVNVIIINIKKVIKRN